MSLISWSLHLLLLLRCCAEHYDQDRTLESIYHRLGDVQYQDQKSLNHAPIANVTFIPSLPVDIWLIVYGHLHKKDMHSLIRSCKFHLHSCRRFIHSLLSVKFKSLLNQNDRKIKIKHLLNIPLVDSIVVSSVSFPFWFGGNNRSSKYIGIDKKSGNGFISFWLKRVDINVHQWKIITILFNQTGVDGVYLSDSSRWTYLTVATKLRPLYDNTSITDRSRAIEQILLNGKIRYIAFWCLNDQWESCMFWPRIRGKFQFAPRCKCYANCNASTKRKLRNAAIAFAVLCIVPFWAVLCLVVAQHFFHIKILY